MTHARYPAYKPSGVDWLGDIPDHWNIKRLKYLSNINPSKSAIKHLSEETEVSFLPMESIGDDGSLDLEQIKVLKDVSAGYTFFVEDDVVIAKITPCFENGKGALAQGLVNGIAFGTTELIVLRANDDLDHSYFARAILSLHIRKLGEGWMYGAGGQKRVPEDFFRNFRFPLPPLPEQRAIAAYLDRETAHIDDLISAQERLITFLEEKRQATISHAVTRGLDPDAPLKPSGIDWIGDIPEHWDAASLGSRYEVQLGKMLNPDAQIGTDLAPFLGNRHVQWDSFVLDDLQEMNFDESDKQRYELRVGDLLVCEGGEIGRCAIWEAAISPCYYQKALHRVRPRNQSRDVPRFLLYAMKAASSIGVFEADGNKSTIIHLTAEKLRRHRFAFPPFSLQLAIVSHLDSRNSEIDNLVDHARRAIDLLRERRSALISAAVTGQIDIRQAVPDAHSQRENIRERTVRIFERQRMAVQPVGYRIRRESGAAPTRFVRVAARNASRRMVEGGRSSSKRRRDRNPSS